MMDDLDPKRNPDTDPSKTSSTGRISTVNESTWRRLRTMLVIASLAIYVMIVIGGIVSATDAGGSCPDWPTCLGQWTAPASQPAQIDYLHRLTALIAGLPLLGAAYLAWKHFRRESLVSWPVFFALAFLAAQVGLGALVSLQSPLIPTSWLAMLHTGLSLLMLAAILLATVAVFFSGRRKRTISFHSLRFSSPFAWLSLANLAVTFILLTSGAIVKASETGAACTAWPLCGGSLLPSSLGGWINISHRMIVALAGILLLAQLIQAWRTQRNQATVLVTSTAAAVLFIAQALLGARLVEGFPAYLLWLHQATAASIWGVMVVQVVAVGIAARTGEDERAEALAFAGRKGLARDLLMLTKPVVVLLLLVTTYAGMIIAGQEFPPLALTFWTLLGGFLAAGGSGAINQYIDREDDLKMQRTQKRPIPSGRLTPAEGLAFGVGAALASFYIMVAFVNFLAALLCLAGIIYYVLLYSIFLKKTTVQNIVIGGGAGAIPPLVGWAAVTGSLSFPSLFLFAIVFLWTPPHFWALALVRRKDYARAGVPMLPVMRGEKATRSQILIYTIELVALTLFLPLFGLGGGLYLIGAAMLGGWLLLAAWRVWKEGGNKLAWKMYRYSSMYLAFLFFTLMADRLL